ncbi:LuxR C-terminal-related transcriptional regulator [Streptomyces sp. NPDC006739]|uniref:helix-turn-helix transcriptional regulator n=1 Tax=Streptomyces sp. NPDC006739 TaxID=3364763 RepID=UPI0036A4A71E
MAGDLREGGPLPKAALVGRVGRAAGPSAPTGSDAGARRLFGRDTEVEALFAALAGLASGTGRAIALVGEPGIGKSTLMGAVAAHARATGVPVFAADGRGTAAAQLPSAPAAVGVHDVAAHTTRGAAVLAAVDDLHHLAADQIASLERLLEATATGPVLCLLAYRQRQLSPALAAALSRAVSAGLLEVWDLQPLSPEQARELLGGHPDADEIHREAMGNPQYLKVIAAHAAGSTDAGTAILGELAGLDPASLAAVRAAAVLGERFHPELLAAVAGLETPAAMAALDTLSGLDLVRPSEAAPHLELRHRAVGEVVYRRLEPSLRMTLHQRAERVLAEQRAPIVRRAHHVARAADPSRPEHVTTLIAAARGILFTSPAVAAGHLRAALELLREGEAHWHEAQVLLARTRLLTGDASESRALLDALRSALSGGESGDVAALADSSRIERRLGRYAEAGALARTALAALADHDTATAAALHTELADYAYDLQDYEASRDHACTAAEIARGCQDRVGEANALGQAALAHLFTGDQATARAMATSAAELIDAASDATLVTNLEAVFQLGMTEGMLGRLVDSERHLLRGAALSRSTGQTYIEPQILTVLANSQLRSGKLARTLETLDETAQHVERVGNPATAAVIAMVRADALFWRNGPGDLPEAVATAERAAAIAGTTPTAWAVSIRCFHAEFVMFTGDAPRARWLMLDAGGGTGLPGLTTWRKPRWCDVLAEAALAEGDHAAVEHWAEVAEACLQELPSTGRHGFALRARMRAHTARGDIERAMGSAQEAVADFSAAGERIEVCRTLLAAAALCLDAGRTGAVADWLNRAAVLAGQCGAARLADEAAHLRGRLAARAGTAGALGALAPLTAREREITRLVSTGMTNREIAEALFLSVRTIESHLGQIYRKLGVSNRASLTRAMLGSGGPPDAS